MGLDQFILVKKKQSTEQMVFEQFRKVNCLQGYFENKYHIENCQEFPIEKHMVEEILSLTEQVLAEPNKGKELFPIQLGFFYGNYEYNDYYIDDVRETYDAFKRLNEHFDEFDEVVYYCWY